MVTDQNNFLSGSEMRDIFLTSNLRLETPLSIMTKKIVMTPHKRVDNSQKMNLFEHV